MFYAASLLLIILGVLVKNSKVLLYVSFLFLLLLFGGNTDNPDRLGYLNNYISLSKGKPLYDFEFGFQLLNKLGLSLGLSYNILQFTIATIGLLLIVNTIKYYRANISFVFILYLIYPFFIDVVQIRNFLAMSFIIYGSRFIISTQKNYLKYTIFVLLASAFHVTSLFYLFGLLTALKDNKKTMYTIIIASILSVFFIPIILQILNGFIPSEKITAYFFTETSLFTKCMVLVYFLTSILLVLISRNIILNSNNENICDQNNKLSKTLINVIDPNAILKLNIICLLTLYFVMNNLDFIRLYRNIFVINYLLFAVALNSITKNYKYYILLFSILLFVSASFILLVLYVPTMNIVKQVLEDNFFF
ncbi:EpsG family protein [Neobacillus sp. 114]|uniref:EpsG family protein n=1 Tax=Neobacillus sp. 114 TaxID=3048535 RepID=UPI0024C3D750|nr:EpsG family protein [Neobacillus sp. 114]